MAKTKRPAVPGSDSAKVPRTWSLKSVLTDKRHLAWIGFFTLYCIIDIVLLGFVSEQITKHGNANQFWPGKEYYHAMGLLLFATIFALLFGLFHWALNLSMTLFTFLPLAVFFGTGAGIILQTPFGRHLRCSQPIESFPTPWQRDYQYCARVTAIEGMSWAMFALSVMGLFWAFFNKFSLHEKRPSVYDLENPKHQRIVEKPLVSDTDSTHTNAVSTHAH